MKSNIVVYLSSPDCYHCGVLSSFWDKNPNGDCVVDTLKKIDPTLTVTNIVCSDKNGTFDYTKGPKQLTQWYSSQKKHWYPMILLLNHNNWNLAMSNPFYSYKNLMNGAYIFNGAIINDQLEFVKKYDHSTVQGYKLWLADCINTFNLMNNKNIIDDKITTNADNGVCDSLINLISKPK